LRGKCAVSQSAKSVYILHVVYLLMIQDYLHYCFRVSFSSVTADSFAACRYQ